MAKSKWQRAKSIFFNYNRIHTSGFTLVEMLVTFAVLASISAASAVSFVTYNKSQTLSNTTKDIQQLLAVAKSKTQSQVKPPSCENRALVGYEFRVCGGAITCETRSLGGDYELVAICAGDGGQPYIVQTVPAKNAPPKKLPQGITFDPSSLGSSYQFKILTGGVVRNGTIILKGPDRSSKEITVDKRGNIGDEN